MNKLFITDLDGTLLNENKEVSPKANSILKKFDNVGVATGRNIFSVYKIIKDVAINSHLILCNGACVYNKSNDTFDSIIPIDKSLHPSLKMVIDSCKTKPIVIGFKDNMPYYQYFENYNAQYDKFLSLASHYKSCLESKVVNYNYDTDIVEIIFYDTEEVIIETKALFEREFPNQFMYECRYSVMIDDSKLWFLAIFDHKVGKGNAIIDMAKRMNVELDNVYVFGDGQNDIDMFNLPVNKIAVKNAIPKLLKLADDIIDEHTKESVIRYIMKENR